jgi:plasmid stabilization system protein ParE
MAYKVRWTTEAGETFDAVIEFLENRWTEREVINFVKETNHLIDQITKHPEMCKSSSKKDIRVGFIAPQTSLFYKIIAAEQLILLLSFWDNRQDPAKRKF